MTFLSYSQNFEDVMLWRALGRHSPGFYIDVGAYDAVVDSVTLAFYDRGWRGINVEPTVDRYNLLAARRPQDINLCLAVSDADGTSQFHEVLDTSMSTTSAEIAESHRKDGFVVVARVVETRKLADICAEFAPDQIHFLKIDVEGAERAVLAGADFSRYRPWIVLVEATVPKEPIPNHDSWEDILLAADYSFVWFDGLNRFYVSNEKHAELAPVFHAPPNVFDDFVSLRSIDAFSNSALVGEALDAERRRRIISALYRVFLSREPDLDGLGHFSGILTRDDDLDSVLAGILSSQEFRLKFSSFCRRYGLAETKRRRKATPSSS